MKLWKPLGAGLVVTVFDAIVVVITFLPLYHWVYSLEPTNVWKIGDIQIGMIFGMLFYLWVGILVLNIILALVYSLLRKGVPGNSELIKGLIFGLCVWAVGTLPGMFLLFTLTTIATTAVTYLTIHSLILCPLKGIIIAAICGK